MNRRSSALRKPAWMKWLVVRRSVIHWRDPTRETIRLGQQIEKLGVDAVSVIAPYFVPLKQEELIAHYSAIADALSIPMFL